MKEIEQLLKETMGLDVASIGFSSLQRSLRLRMKALGLKRTEAYLDLLRTSASEWRELVESVIVTETWFFRDPESLHAFSRLVLNEWLPANPSNVLRLLSLPCSSGEEPYSLAMVLLDAGIPANRFQIDALDISGRALERARLGVYGKNSFRGKHIVFRSRYFRLTKDGYMLDPAVRKQVQFFQANVLDPKFMPFKASYDFVFCRNLLIYFDRPTQKKALEQIESLLSDGGLLFVGPAEQPLLLDQGFVSAGMPMSFACRKSVRPVAPRERVARPARPMKLPPGAPSLLDPPTQPHLAPNRLAPETFSQDSSTTQSGFLDQACTLADAGRFAEASVLCEAHLLAHGASAQAYYLLGLIHDAASDTRAHDCYRKALYLDPNHYHSLLQMALLSQKNGQSARARTFRERAERVRTKAAAVTDGLQPATTPNSEPALDKINVISSATGDPSEIIEI